MRAICDTHVLLFHALAPERLSRLAARAVAAGTENGQLACADISLWEIGMLHARGRLGLPADVRIDRFIADVLLDLQLQVLPITPEIAAVSQDPRFAHGDPADRLIEPPGPPSGPPSTSGDSK
jgi:PIN domain nuclease of toxin-antitoxin system